MKKLTLRKNQKHKQIVDWKYFRVYYSGAYALLELDFGQSGHGELSILFGCIDRLVNWIYIKPWHKDVAY
jgi:hypothetical protein